MQRPREPHSNPTQAPELAAGFNSQVQPAPKGGKSRKIRTLGANITRQLQGQDVSTTMHQPKSSSCSPHFRNHVDQHCRGPLEEFGNIFLAQPRAGTHRLRGHFLLTPDFTLIVPSQQPLIKRLPLAFLLKINLIK